MPYRAVLHDLLSGCHGSIGAMFLDWEGEAVTIVSQYFPHYDLQIIGAYEGIFLDHLRRVSRDLDLGVPERFVVHCENFMLFNWALKDGYYLVLVLQHTDSEGLAWRRMELCRDVLMQDL